jgi:hypothetical protein
VDLIDDFISTTSGSAHDEADSPHKAEQPPAG